MDFNLTVSERLLPGSPVGTGDLFNFRLQQERSEPLVLKTQDRSEDGILRTYYTDPDEAEHHFGNSLVLNAW